MNSSPRRSSPLAAVLSDHGSAVLHEQPVALTEPSAAVADPEALTICDASVFPRFQVSGPGAGAWLEQQGVALPDALFGWTPQDPDGICLRTGRNEYLIEDGPVGSRVGMLARQLGAGRDGVYGLSRQDAQILLRGAQVSEVLAQVCGVDFREPGERLVFTRLAGVSAVVLPPQPEQPWFRMWVDATHAVYLWQTLLQIVQEMGGDVSHLASFFPTCSDLSQSSAQAEEHPQ